MEKTATTISALFRADAIPSLVLVMGAFLVLTSSAAFAQVTDLPLTSKLTLLLAATATLWLAGHQLRGHREVRLAGTVFECASALLVPIDLVVLAYTVFDLPRIATELLWAGGSLAAAALYAGLAAAGYGRAYSYLLMVFVLHAVVRLLMYWHADVQWYLAAAAAVALVVDLIRLAAKAPRAELVVGPLDPWTPVLAAGTALLAGIGHWGWMRGAPSGVGPAALLSIAVCLSVYAALRARLGGPTVKNAAAAGPVVTYYALIRMLTEPGLELIAAPAGAYMIALAVWSHRVGIRIVEHDRRTLEAVGAVMVLAPLAVARIELITTARTLVESLGFLVAGTAVSRPRLAVVGALSVGILGIRLVASGVASIGPWLVVGMTGIALLFVGAALLRWSAKDVRE